MKDKKVLKSHIIVSNTNYCHVCQLEGDSLTTECPGVASGHMRDLVANGSYDFVGKWISKERK